VETTKERLASEARLIAERMRHDANPLAQFSSESLKTTFYPFAEWYESVADALEGNV